MSERPTNQIDPPAWSDIGREYQPTLLAPKIPSEVIKAGRALAAIAEDQRAALKHKTRKRSESKRAKRPAKEETQQDAIQGPDGEEIPSLLLIDDMEGILRRYVILPEHAYLPVTLWALATHFGDCFECFPYLVLTSPTPRCGKSRTQEVLEFLTWKPWRGTGISEAALFRMLGGCPPPTLLLDECEYLGRGRQTERAEALNALLNSGYRRGQTVPRCVPKGREFEIVHFQTYGPKCLASIGRLPDTILDRALVISMQRRAPNEHIERFLFSRVASETSAIRDSVKTEMHERAVDVLATYNAIADLEFLSDRDAEISAPLFAVAQAFCPARVGELRDFLTELFGVKSSAQEDESLNLRLLSDIRRVWPEGSDAVSTAELLASLKQIEDAPWEIGRAHV